MRLLLSPIQCGCRKQFPTLFGFARCHTTTNSLNRKISDCVRNGNVDDAHKLFDEFPDSRNTLISAYRNAQNPEKVHHHFIRMMGDGARSDEFTFSVIMSAVLNTKFNVLVPQLHGLVLRLGLDRHNYVDSFELDRLN